MNDLLEFVLDAHGGRKRWSEVKTLTTQLAVGGTFWKLRGFPDAFLRETLEIDVHRQHAPSTLGWLPTGVRNWLIRAA